MKDTKIEESEVEENKTEEDFNRVLWITSIVYMKVTNFNYEDPGNRP